MQSKTTREKHSSKEEGKEKTSYVPAKKKTLHKQWAKKKSRKLKIQLPPTHPPTPRAHLSYGPPLMAMDTDTLF